MNKREGSAKDTLMLKSILSSQKLGLIGLNKTCLFIM